MGRNVATILGARLWALEATLVKEIFVKEMLARNASKVNKYRRCLSRFLTIDKFLII